MSLPKTGVRRGGRMGWENPSSETERQSWAGKAEKQLQHMDKWCFLKNKNPNSVFETTQRNHSKSNFRH